MICETCHGLGVVWGVDHLPVTPEITGTRTPIPFPFCEPCPDCGGSGRAHCCEGLREQPDG